MVKLTLNNINAAWYNDEMTGKSSSYIIEDFPVISSLYHAALILRVIINLRKPPSDKVVVSFDCEGINLDVKG